MTDSKLPTVPLPRHLHPRHVPRFPRNRKVPGSVLIWARRIAGGGPDHIFYESDGQRGRFIVRCITDPSSTPRDRARTRPGCGSCGAERALGYPPWRRHPRCASVDRQRRQVATSLRWGSASAMVRDRGRTRPAEVSAAPLTSTASSSDAEARAGVGRIPADSAESMTRPDLALAREEFAAGAVRRPQPASLERLDDATGALVGVVRGRIIGVLEALPSDCRRPGLGLAAHEEAERTCRRQLAKCLDENPSGSRPDFCRHSTHPQRFYQTWKRFKPPLFEGLWDSSVFSWQDAFNHRPLRSSARALARSTS